MQDGYVKFKELVATKYQLYNGLFLTLPFADIPIVGAELPVFAELCQAELKKGKDPAVIVTKFFRTIVHTSDFAKQISILLLILQFVERQVVLFDALEDAAFACVHDMSGEGSLENLLKKISTTDKTEDAIKKLETYRTRIVLTAHPTQFYPPQVLSVIQDLGEAITKNDLKDIQNLLLQLGKTSFRNRRKPTPIDEAEIIIYYLEHFFYPAIKKIYYSMNLHVIASNFAKNYLPGVIELGFWPGGDRDGNPNVTVEITLRVAARLKSKILQLYIQEIKQLRRRLTFPNMWACLEIIQNRLNATIRTIHGKSKNGENAYTNCGEFIDDLSKIKMQLIAHHQGLFSEQVDTLLSLVAGFGFYFASLDLRQDSHVHTEVLSQLLKQLVRKHLLPRDLNKECNSYRKLSSIEKTQLLEKLIEYPASSISFAMLLKDSLTKDVIESLRALRIIQTSNGEHGLHRYIISNTHAVYNVFEVILLAHLAGWAIKSLSLDIVPLFETIDDLDNAEAIMRELYSNRLYQQHLKRRNNQQTIMLGFSDGTKDGGYVTANWAIFRCKKRLTHLAKEFSIRVIFFDGRGGPPARGGGNTHKFYRAMQSEVAQEQIHLTIQGQTISTNYGTIPSAIYNIEQLFTSGLEGLLFLDSKHCMAEQEYLLLEELSGLSYAAYQQLKQHPLFVPYLEQITPLQYYGELNIASRPPRRGRTRSLTLTDLRAIPFVGAWTQMKQNIPGFYGLGSALKALIGAGQETQLKSLYQHSLFFRTLLENAMQSLLKSFFLLTSYLAKDKKFGKFWQILQHEAELTVTMLKQVSGQGGLLENNLDIRESILMRENLVLPLLVIQQYALIELRKGAKGDKAAILRKIILKSLAANINADRNAV